MSEGEGALADLLISLLQMAENRPPSTPIDTANGVVYEKPVWDEHWCALVIGRFGDTQVLVYDFLATSAIIVPDGPYSYEHRWCFETRTQAIVAAMTWLKTGAPEPEGWHRHLPSNRRREHGDPTTEYINP
jgi:hypothetical protein